MRSTVIAMAALLAALAATAQEGDFHLLLEEGQRLLDSGEYDAAIKAMQQAQIENPEAEVVPYGIGVAHFEKGRSLAMADPAAAAEAFGAARDAFARLENAANPALRREAAVGRATAQAFMARLADPTQDYQDILKGMREAIGQLDEFTQQYPDHETAQHNLDAARLGLKELLQAPPPPPPPQQQNAPGEEEEEQNEQEQEQEQNQEPGESSDDSQDQEDGENEAAGPQEQQPEDSEANEQEESPDEGDNPQEEPQPGDEDEQQPQEQPEAGEPSEEDQQQQAQSVGAADEESPDMQNIEAILESLEDLDRREQKSLKQTQYGQEMRGGWW
jgi:hypothetical protein